MTRKLALVRTSVENPLIEPKPTTRECCHAEKAKLRRQINKLKLHLKSLRVEMAVLRTALNGAMEHECD